LDGVKAVNRLVNDEWSLHFESRPDQEADKFVVVDDQHSFLHQLPSRQGSASEDAMQPRLAQYPKQGKSR